jgi:hypothetical protein
MPSQYAARASFLNSVDELSFGGMEEVAPLRRFLFLDKFYIALDAVAVAPGLQDFCIFNRAATIDR